MSADIQTLINRVEALTKRVQQLEIYAKMKANDLRAIQEDVSRIGQRLTAPEKAHGK